MNLSFDKNSRITCNFWTPSENQPEEGEGILVIKFEGVADNDAEFFGGYNYMLAMIGAGKSVWESGGLILDFTELEYSWGDNMSSVIGIAREGGEWHEEEMPLAIAVSSKCSEGMISLINVEMGLKHENYLSNGLEEAFKLLEIKRKNV